MSKSPLKTTVKTDKAPGAIGPYSQAIAASGFLFVSGQIPLDPRTGELVGAGVAEETRQVLCNIEAVLKEAGAGLPDVVKTTVYLTDLAAFGEFNSVYGEFFKEPYPARATVEVSALPKGALVEVDVIAVINVG